MKMNLTQSQSQTVTPQIMQTMEILQMDAIELKTYIEQMAMENPVIELTDPLLHDETEITLEKLNWLENSGREKAETYELPQSFEQDDPLKNYGLNPVYEESLIFFLKMQVHVLNIPEELERAVNWIIDNLDDNGWYRPLGFGNAFPGGIEQRAIEIVQSLEPAGIGASDLRECLLIQLRRLGCGYDLEIRIVENHMEPLSKNHYNAISSQLNVPQVEIRSACDIIRKLNPRPGSGFLSHDKPLYIRPDLVVADTGGQLTVEISDRDIPDIRLNSYYHRLLKESDDKELRYYLSDKVRQAKWLLQCVNQRKATILRCAEIIADIQKQFFLYGKGLVPMTLSDVAARVELHESTVSRAIRGKYLLCGRGVYPLSNFFTRNVMKKSFSSATQDDAMNLIHQLISGEDKHNPLSDQKLCELMKSKGVEVSRRTVAKYRLELNIPPATGRKEI